MNSWVAVQYIVAHYFYGCVGRQRRIKLRQKQDHQHGRIYRLVWEGASGTGTRSLVGVGMDKVRNRRVRRAAPAINNIGNKPTSNQGIK